MNRMNGSPEPPMTPRAEALLSELAHLKEHEVHPGDAVGAISIQYIASLLDRVARLEREVADLRAS